VQTYMIIGPPYTFGDQKNWRNLRDSANSGTSIVF
jgi:hypothetical protein